MRRAHPACPVCTPPLRPVVVQAQPPVSWEARSEPDRRPVVPAVQVGGTKSGKMYR